MRKKLVYLVCVFLMLVVCGKTEISESEAWNILEFKDASEKEYLARNLNKVPDHYTRYKIALRLFDCGFRQHIFEGLAGLDDSLSSCIAKDLLYSEESMTEKSKDYEQRLHKYEVAGFIHNKFARYLNVYDSFNVTSRLREHSDETYSVPAINKKNFQDLFKSLHDIYAEESWLINDSSIYVYLGTESFNNFRQNCLNSVKDTLYSIVNNKQSDSISKITALSFLQAESPKTEIRLLLEKLSDHHACVRKYAAGRLKRMDFKAKSIDERIKIIIAKQDLKQLAYNCYLYPTIVKKHLKAANCESFFKENAEMEFIINTILAPPKWIDSVIANGDADSDTLSEWKPSWQSLLTVLCISNKLTESMANRIVHYLNFYKNDLCLPIILDKMFRILGPSKCKRFIADNDAGETMMTIMSNHGWKPGNVWEKCHMWRINKFKDSIELNAKLYAETIADDLVTSLAAVDWLYDFVPDSIASPLIEKYLWTSNNENLANRLLNGHTRHQKEMALKWATAHGRTPVKAKGFDRVIYGRR